jgi:hypothetical protein
MGDPNRIQWGKVLFGMGVALMAVAWMVAAINKGRPAVISGPPPSVRVVSAASMTPQSAPAPAVEAASCDAHLAPDAILRDRGTGAQIVGRAIRLLEIFNNLPENSIHVLGWATEESDEGPPCYATFAWEMRGARHTARFKFWPRQPARLATFNAEAGDMADSVDMLGVGGVAHTQAQIAIAGLMRLGSGFLAEDVYMNPQSETELLVRRPHCVPGNVDFSGSERGVRTMARAMRRAGITRVRCIADNPWVSDIPPRGRIQPPYLPQPEGGT